MWNLYYVHTHILYYDHKLTRCHPWRVFWIAEIVPHRVSWLQNPTWVTVFGELEGLGMVFPDPVVFADATKRRGLRLNFFERIYDALQRTLLDWAVTTASERVCFHPFAQFRYWRKIAQSNSKRIKRTSLTVAPSNNSQLSQWCCIKVPLWSERGWYERWLRQFSCWYELWQAENRTSRKKPHLRSKERPNAEKGSQLRQKRVEAQHNVNKDQHFWKNL